MTTIHPNAEWHPISTAPRDGTIIDLTGPDGEVWPMSWSVFAGMNQGIWAMRGRLSGALLSTWDERDPDGAPTHWRHRVS